MSDDNLPAGAPGANAPAVQQNNTPPASTGGFLEGSHLQSGRIDYFGETVSTHEARENMQQITAHMSMSLQGHASSGAIAGARQWLENVALEPPSGRESPQHKYSIDTRGLPRDTAPYVVSFLNFAARSGFSQGDVQAVINWYRDLSNGGQQQSSGGDANDVARSNAEGVLRAKWGESYYSNLRAVNRYIDNLPKVERDELEARELSNGSLALNDPATLEALLTKANKGPSPLANEIAQLEARMKNDRRAWFRDEQAQARLRQLYRERDGN